MGSLREPKAWGRGTRVQPSWDLNSDLQQGKVPSQASALAGPNRIHMKTTGEQTGGQGGPLCFSLETGASCSEL